MMQLEQIAKRLSRRCLAFFVKDLPLELKPWGEAMLAELPQAHGIFAPVSWAMGGSMFLSKALLRRWFSGKALRSSSVSPGRGGANSPSPWQRAALVVLVLSFGMGLSSNFRQAVSTSLESWNPVWSPYQIGHLDRLLQSAEELHDPASLAFVALNTRDSRKAERLAEQAVQRDPQLEWVWYPLIQGQLIEVSPDMDLRGPVVTAMIERLKAWDPDNAVPYLLDAERTRWDELGSFHRFSPLVSPRDAEGVQRERAWRSAMEKAFAAPRYDSYSNRQTQLQRAVLLKLRVERPLTFVNGIYWHAIPIWFNTKQYSDLLLKEGDDALHSGDSERAGASYWQAAHFAERMRAQATTAYERFYAAGLQRDSYQKLSALMAQTHQDAQKARIDQTLAYLQKERDKVSDAKGFWELLYGPISGAGIAVSISAVIALIALALSLAGMGYFFLRQWLRFPAPRLLDSMLTKAARSAPFALAASCLCLYFAYLPYAQLYAGYLNGTLRPEDGERLRSFMQIRYFPDVVLSFFGFMPGLRIWFWGTMIAVMAATLAAFVWRWAQVGKARPLRAS